MKPARLCKRPAVKRKAWSPMYCSRRRKPLVRIPAPLTYTSMHQYIEVFEKLNHLISTVQP